VKKVWKESKPFLGWFMIAASFLLCATGAMGGLKSAFPPIVGFGLIVAGMVSPLIGWILVKEE